MSPSSSDSPPSPALPDCADFIARWNHKDTRHVTIERLARLLDEARAAIDDDDCLRYANVPGRNLRASHDDARRKDGPKTDANAQAGADASPAPANVSSVAAIPLDPDKAQAARAALRAHRCQGRN